MKRFLLYNIRYAAGTGAGFNLPVPGAGYLRGNRENLLNIREFIKSMDPDIVGLIEVDTGSIRTGMVNQAEIIAGHLGHYTIYESKYGEDSLNSRLPIVRKQGNAFLAAPRVHGERFHYFELGIKRLIIELELEDVAIFLVHLSLKYRHRQSQLRRLHELVAGDFNPFWGEDELYLFMEASGMRSANVEKLPSYPSQAPRKELDFILYGPGIEMVDFQIPRVCFSDHLPLVCDFRISESAQRAA